MMGEVSSWVEKPEIGYFGRFAPTEVCQNQVCDKMWRISGKVASQEYIWEVWNIRYKMNS